MRHGHTLPELATVLLLAALALTVVLPGASATRDRFAVAGAREALAGLIAEARLLAVTHGGATVHLEAGTGRVWSQVGDSVVRALGLASGWGVSVALPGSRSGSLLRYDALGLGVVASETVRLRRGAAEAVLVVSGYGRVRRP